MPFLPGELNAIGPDTIEVDFNDRDLSKNEITSLCERLVVNAQNLERLNLSENPQLDLEDLQERFGQLPVGNNLRELRLDSCAIGEEGEAILAEVIQNNPNLEVLSLNENKLTETIALELLEALEHQYRLTELNLNDNFDNEREPIEQGTLEAIDVLLQRNRNLQAKQEAEQKNKDDNDHQGPGDEEEKKGDKNNKRKKDDDNDRDEGGNNSEKRAKTTETPSSSTRLSGEVSRLVKQSREKGGGVTV